MSHRSMSRNCTSSWG